MVEEALDDGSLSGPGDTRPVVVATTIETEGDG